MSRRLGLAPRLRVAPKNGAWAWARRRAPLQRRRSPRQRTTANDATSLVGSPSASNDATGCSGSPSHRSTWLVNPPNLSHRSPLCVDEVTVFVVVELDDGSRPRHHSSEPAAGAAPRRGGPHLAPPRGWRQSQTQSAGDLASAPRRARAHLAPRRGWRARARRRGAGAEGRHRGQSGVSSARCARTVSGTTCAV